MRANTHNIPIKAIIQALIFFILRNVFSFGYKHWHLVSRTAMGTPLAPTNANHFVMIHKDLVYLQPT